MRKYLIVRIDNADEMTPEKPIFANGSLVWPYSNMAQIRKAVHKASDTHFISVADAPTHSPMGIFTRDEEDKIAEIFEGALKRAKDRCNGK